MEFSLLLTATVNKCRAIDSKATCTIPSFIRALTLAQNKTIFGSHNCDGGRWASKPGVIFVFAPRPSPFRPIALNPPVRSRSESNHRVEGAAATIDWYARAIPPGSNRVRTSSAKLIVGVVAYLISGARISSASNYHVWKVEAPTFCSRALPRLDFPVKLVWSILTTCYLAMLQLCRNPVSGGLWWIGMRTSQPNCSLMGRTLAIYWKEWLWTNLRN
jgi:hypothetical protein